MYESFFGLRERPFDLAVNPRFLYLTARHREALGNLRYGIAVRQGVTLLVGEAGMGKTTLVRAAIESHAATDALIISLSNPTLTRAEFVEFLARKFNLPDDAASSKAAFLIHLEKELLRRRERKAVTALVIDEAQALPLELLEEIRLLANLETSTDKLLPLVLAGQPEIADRLSQPALRQLKQRVALRCILTPLDFADTAAYIARRIETAGGRPSAVFTREAVETIFVRSGGIPRTISVICDNALVTAFAADERPVSRSTVLEVCKDFDLIPEGSMDTGRDSVVLQRVTEPPRDPRPSKPASTFDPVSATAFDVKPQPAEKAADAEVQKSRAQSPVRPQLASGEYFSLYRARKRFSFFKAVS
jgi:type II secretory pathway predicted ATPase ExeA